MYGLALSQSDCRALSYFNQYTINFHLVCENQVILEFLRAYHGFIYYSLNTLKHRLRQHLLFGKAKDNSTLNIDERRLREMTKCHLVNSVATEVSGKIFPKCSLFLLSQV